MRRCRRGAGAEPEPVDGQPGAQPNPEFDALVGKTLNDLTVAQAKDRYRDLLRVLGPTGATAISSRLRRDGYPTNRQTVHDWLAQDEAIGLAARSDEGWIWVGPTP